VSVCLRDLATDVVVWLSHFCPFCAGDISITLFGLIKCLHISTVIWDMAWFIPALRESLAATFFLVDERKVTFWRFEFSITVMVFSLSCSSMYCMKWINSFIQEKATVLVCGYISQIQKPLERKAGSIPIIFIGLLLGLCLWTLYGLCDWRMYLGGSEILLWLFLTDLYLMG